MTRLPFIGVTNLESSPRTNRLTGGTSFSNKETTTCCYEKDYYNTFQEMNLDFVGEYQNILAEGINSSHAK